MDYHTLHIHNANMDCHTLYSANVNMDCHTPPIVRM